MICHEPHNPYETNKNGFEAGGVVRASHELHESAPTRIIKWTIKIFPIGNMHPLPAGSPADCGGRRQGAVTLNKTNENEKQLPIYRK